MVAIAPAETLRPLTYDDLLAMPDDGKRFEIINGELTELTGPTPKHQLTLNRLLRALDRVVDQHKYGVVLVAPVDVMLSVHDIVQPDIVFIGANQLDIVRDQWIERAPLLVMEIVSPSSRRRDLITKAALYARSGVQEYWIVDPERATILVQTAVDGVFQIIPVENGIATSLVIPELAVLLSDIFATPDWIRPNVVAG